MMRHTAALEKGRPSSSPEAVSDAPGPWNEPVRAAGAPPAHPGPAAQAREDVRGVRTPLHVATQVGGLLGRRALLQRPLPRHGTEGEAGVGVAGGVGTPSSSIGRPN
jgi:hypothetical protein